MYHIAPHKMASMIEAMNFLVDIDFSAEDEHKEEAPSPTLAGVVSQAPMAEQENKRESLNAENYLADFLYSVVFDAAPPFNDAQQQQSCVMDTTKTTATEADDSMPDMNRDEDDDECASILSTLSTAKAFDPLAPEDFVDCPDCAYWETSIGCTGCGQQVCMKHTHNDGHGGKGTYASSPGGFVCSNCMVYHHY